MLRDGHELVVSSGAQRDVKERHRGSPDQRRKTILDNIVKLDDSVKNKPVEFAEWWARVSLTSKR
jgi:hypothetical protein